MDIDGDDGAPTPSDVAVVMYTSGSPGAPEDVVATHRNFITAINGLAAVRKAYCTHGPGEGTYTAYLPLAHVSELAAELLAFGTGTPIGYASAKTLIDGLTGLAEGCHGDAMLLRPTQMAAGPLIVERICKNISNAVASKGLLFKALFDCAIEYKISQCECGFDTPLLNLLLFKEMRSVLGSRLKVLVCGSAPLSTRTRRFAQACVPYHRGVRHDRHVRRGHRQRNRRHQRGTSGRSSSGILHPAGRLARGPLLRVEQAQPARPSTATP